MLGRQMWSPLSVAATVELFRAAPFRWWISGGHALELHLRRSWRDHHDADVGVCRIDLARVVTWLDGWDLRIPQGGELHSVGRSVDMPPANNLWCRRSGEDRWQLDVTIGDGTERHWIYRRDASINLPWSLAVLRSDDGTPYLAPELQLLFKSKSVRPKDQIDAEQVMPALSYDRRAWLWTRLPAQHPWRQLLDVRSTQ